MTPKNILTALLLIFAVGSAAYVLVGKPSASPDPDGGNSADSVTVTGPSTESDTETGAETQLIVYYMDMGKDCTTCLQLENYTYETLESQFGDELAAGTIAWRAIDLDNPANEHYVNEFGLYTKSVVLVRLHDGEQVRFESLSRIWELVYDKEAFMAYIQEQVQEFLDDAGTPV